MNCARNYGAEYKKKNVKEGLAVKWGCGWEILTLYGFASIEYF